MLGLRVTPPVVVLLAGEFVLDTVLPEVSGVAVAGLVPPGSVRLRVVGLMIWGLEEITLGAAVPVLAAEEVDDPAAAFILGAVTGADETGTLGTGGMAVLGVATEEGTGVPGLFATGLKPDEEALLAALVFTMFCEESALSNCDETELLGAFGNAAFDFASTVMTRFVSTQSL